jgi:voltage-gated potassium channel
MLDAERGDPEANITNFPDALWWGMTTISTVGYGDQFPVTGEGRLIAVGLMLAGIALLGVVTATIASWFVERIGAVEVAEQQTQRELDVVVQELQALRAELRATTSGADSRTIGSV